ncbi:putative Ntn-hydrolase superfamily protein [Plasticicumulans lactativorans]|uniref:Putative Ntn-hydrolase superfamily protein n=1 Tax=Plasticicumulans lactativorans TaxID=1133106 RepID=A0A4R2L366_9GAMM|nr:DUF1028 domain-containing protein [Plasticicumulans lactativorans]TCO80934.1 putative Ntn-hydrolase superfamily protein [Plasticicumulans lactativorans]
MTFSIVGFDPANGDLGVAVQSKFPNVGVSIPFARAGVGAVATQSYCNTSFGPRGLSLLENGASPEQALEVLTGTDADRDYRQVGIVDACGRAASFTGAACFGWAGGRVGGHCAVQGNTLAGAAVVEAMYTTFTSASGPLVERLLRALAAGQAAGGDRRGQQSAAVKVVRAGGGYGGHDDRYVDISVYDHPTPIAELERLYGLHRLTYFRSPPEQLVPITPTLALELRRLLHARGFYAAEPAAQAFDAETRRALRDFMGWENYDERMRDDDLIDLEVLADMRAKHAAWMELNK